MTNKYIFLIQFDGGSFVENPSSIDIGGKSPLTLLPIRIALVLGRKRPRLRYRPKKHFRDSDPILAVGTRQERFCVRVSLHLHLVSRMQRTHREGHDPEMPAHAH